MSTPRERPHPPVPGEPSRRVAPSAGGPGSAALAGGGLSAAAGSMLAATVEVLCRDQRLGLSEIGDHTDRVAEVADALSALTDRLARDLVEGASDRTATREAARGLHAIRDSLRDTSSTARGCADELYRAHVESGPAPGA